MTLEVGIGDVAADVAHVGGGNLRYLSVPQCRCQSHRLQLGGPLALILGSSLAPLSDAEKAS